MSRAFELGLGVQSDKPPGAYGPIARRAEELGFDVVTVYADLLFQPPLPALLEMARATEHVRLGPSCLNPFTLHPVEIAGQTAVLDAASAGRAFLGLARGSWLEALDLDAAAPVTAIRETVEIVRRLLRGDDSGFSGERFSLAPGARLRYTVSRAEVPLLVGTWSPRLAAYAGESADELKIGGSANADVVPVLRERIGNERVGIVVGAVTVCYKDGAEARRLARAEVAMYLSVVAELDPTVELDPELVARIRERDAAGDRDGAGALIPDDVLRRFAFAGTPEEIAEHAAAVRDAGAGRIDFGTPHGDLELLGEAVRLLRE